jgi:quinol monooxygenase YgiN
MSADAAPRQHDVAVTTVLCAKPGKEGALVAVLRTLSELVLREEPGCLQYVATRSRHEPTRFLVLERYRDEQALADHANSAHLRDAVPDLMDCLESPPEVAIFEPLGA